MAYVATIHKPTSICLALRIKLDAGEDESEGLVFAQSNRLQVWRVTTEGMTSLHTKLVFGTITVLQRLRSKSSDSDLLFVGTDRHEYFCLTWNQQKRQLDTFEDPLHDRSESLLDEPFTDDTDCLNKCLVDPTGRYMVMHLWEGVLNISRLVDRGKLKIVPMEQVRISELFLKSSTFIDSPVGPRIALLYRSTNDGEDAQLAIYKLTSDDRHVVASAFSQRDRVYHLAVPDKMAHILIPVPMVDDENRKHHVRNTSVKRAQLGGVLAVGETSILYLDTSDFTALDCHLDEANIFIAWAQYDDTRYFLADDFGRLHLLTILTDGAFVTGVQVKQLSGLDSHGQPVLISKASCLVHMGNGMLFLGSHHGDSQLLRVDLTSDPKAALTLMDPPPALSNNAPILDFVVMDLGNREGDVYGGNSFSSGQARIVAGCGIQKDGSLRSIRSGVGLEDLGILDDFEKVRAVFTLQSYGSPMTDILVVALVLETRIFKFDKVGAIEELDSFQGMALNRQTLLAANLPSGHLLQVTPEFVAILDPESGIVMDRWAPEDIRKEEELGLPWKISKASENGTWLILSLDGRRIVSLNLQQHLKSVVRSITPGSTTEGDLDQVSCVHASAVDPSLGVVGFWKRQAVSLCNLESLEPYSTVELPSTDDSAVVAQDAVVVQLHPPNMSGPTLLIAQDDGNVVSCDVDRDDWQVSGRKSVVLGTSEARLHILPRGDGRSNVFATAEHSSLIYSDQGRLMYSATTADDATHVAPFNSESEDYRDTIIIATTDHIRISRIDTERRTHVTTLKVGETVRRLAYSGAFKAFGLGCLKRQLVGGAEVITTSFKLVDEVVFQLLGKPYQFDCNKRIEMPECVIRASLFNCHGEFHERFLVGTCILPEDLKSQSTGRIWIFGVDDSRSPYVVGSVDLKEPCKCLAQMGQRIVAGLHRTVVVYDYLETDNTVGLQKLATYRPSTLPKDISVFADTIGVADMMKSLTLVRFTAPAKGAKAKLEETDRHFQSVWTSALGHIENDMWLEASASGSLLVLQKNSSGLSDFDKKQIKVTSELHLGEQVNRIRPLEVLTNNRAIVAPKAFLGTVDGGMYLFGLINPEYQTLLINFQAHLAEQIESPGGISFLKYRASRLAPKLGEKRRDEPYRFVDGELLERFLGMDETKQEVICEEMGQKAEYMRGIVEQLKRLL